MRSTRVRWATASLVAGGLLIAVAVGVFLYDRDSVKKLPVVGDLPWQWVIGNTAVRAEARDVPERARDLAVAHRQQPQVVIVGDSLAGKWPVVGTTAWTREMRPLHAMSLGVASDRTQHLLYRIRSGEFSGLAPRVGVLIIGTNNVNRNTPEEIREAVVLIVDELRRVWTDTSLIVVGVLPRQLPEGQARQRRIDTVNALLTDAFQSRERVRFLHLRNEFLSGDGGLNRALYESDGIHLSAAGYDRLTQSVVPTIIEAASAGR